MSSDNPSFLGRIFRRLWSVVIFLYRGLMMLFLVLFGVALWIAIRGGPPIKVEDNVALVVYPTGTLVETADRDAGQRFFEALAGELPSQTLLRDVVRALDAGAKDPRIALAVVKLDHLAQAGVPQLEELGAAVRRFRESGKPVYAYGPYFDQNHYLVAAQADHVAVDPFGGVDLTGFGLYQQYFREGIDKLGIDVNVFRVGEYKSAIEPFERSNMSPEARRANAEWLGDLWRSYGRLVGNARKLPESTVDEYVRLYAEGLEKNGGDAAAYAQAMRLVDAVETLEQFRERVGAKVGMDPEHGSFRQIHHARYLQALDDQNGEAAGAQHKIALVVVQGEIVDGYSQPGLAGGETVAELLREARTDDAVAAVVLRIDSPGGSVFASEQIRRGVQALQAAGKPVVASMSSLAASGGYWAAMDADEIWAHDTTVTGSIGIFALWPTIEKPLLKLGINTDGIGTTPLAGAFRIDRPLPREGARIIQALIEQGYRRFIEGVAQGRDLPPQRVEEIAKGRVWSGEDARELGLIDQIGGLQPAVRAAAQLADVGEGAYYLEEILPREEFPLLALLRFAGQARSWWSGGVATVVGLPERLRPLVEVADQLRWLSDPRGIYAHCFCRPAVASRSWP